jgi:hypothetical protein
MNPWLQTKLYECHLCDAKYLHDKAREHQLYRCPRRVAIVQGAGPSCSPNHAGGRALPLQPRYGCPILLNGR